MPEQRVIRSVLTILLSGLALAAILMALWNSALQVTVVGSEPAPAAISSSGLPSTPPSSPLPWYERIVEGTFTLLVTGILCSRFVLLAGILLFYGYIFVYVAPQAWRHIRPRRARTVTKSSSR